MKAKARELIKFLRNDQSLVVPIYQRMYDWEKKLCEELWKDIKKLSQENDEVKKPHFIGSIVRVETKINEDDDEVPQQIIIDGQQRMTTITLLLSAIMYKLIEQGDSDRAKELKETYLVNPKQKGNLYYKILLGEEDRESLKTIIDGKAKKENISSKRIKENFEFFEKKLDNEIIGKIINGIRKLVLVDIYINSGSEEEESPHQIFESLNSKGLPLTSSDLIRNYILMGQTEKNQKTIYNDYWRKMEKEFGQEKFSKHFGNFMRHYLTMKTGKIPRINEIYERFKDYFGNEKKIDEIKKLLAEICDYSRFYIKMALGEEPDNILKKEFEYLNDLKIDPVYPFLLAIYSDYSNNHINRDELKNILSMIQSYVFRRFVCGISANSFNKTFDTLHEDIIKKKYFLSLKVAFAKMEKYKRFPNDTEFAEALKQRDLYNIRHTHFWLERYEHFENNERVDIDKKITIEHIMPQNKKLNSAWQKMLGVEVWQSVQEKYLHTLGNLTFTGYNPTLSDKSFEEKKVIYDESPFKLNRSLKGIDVWDEKAIEDRAKALSNEMVKIWKGVDDISEKDIELIENLRKES